MTAEQLKRLKHHFLGCTHVQIGWTDRGNIVSRCNECGQHYVTYGIVNAWRVPVTQDQAWELIDTRKKVWFP